jgi:hypothetical protein
MLVADTAGIFVPLFERAATAIAAGVVVGSFAGATRGFISGRSRKQVEGNALRDGYFGAVILLCLLLLDQCIIYAASI